MGNQNGSAAKDNLEGRDVRQLDQHVSAALAKGVRYNMKILIRGQRKTGKTQLLRRLQGLDFIAEYTPTPEITTAHLIWTCPATDEKVKVEFWDVVDKGMQPSTTWAGVTGGKGGEPAEASQQENVVLLDAETIDVNRGCDGVILVHDPSRPETLAYCLALLRDIRAEVPALIVSSFADSRRAVKSKELATAIKQHSLCASLSVCAKDGFGVDLVRDFLTVPFLAIKQRYALRLLSSAKEAIGTTRTRLDTFGDTLNFAAHCQQWSAGGAALAAQQAARMQAVHKAAAAAAPGDESPTPKAKMVPIEKLMLPPRIDEQAPDLGKEVATFNTGKIDENFFSSDDEMASEVQVLSLEDEDDEPAVALAPTEGEADSDSESAPASTRKPPPPPLDRHHLGIPGKGGGAGGVKKEEKEESQSDESEEVEEEEEREGTEEERRLEAERASKAAEAERLAQMRAAAAAKIAEEEERLKNHLSSLQLGALDLSSDEDEQAAASSKALPDKAANQEEAGESSDSDDSAGGRPMVMQDEDLSD